MNTFPYYRKITSNTQNKKKEKKLHTFLPVSLNNKDPKVNGKMCAAHKQKWKHFKL